MEMGSFVWYRRLPHVVIDHRRRWMIELIRFGDTKKRTFWTLRLLVREFTWGDYKHYLGE